MREKIAIIGSGISGISAAYLLSSKYDVYLFEKNNRLGGHTELSMLKNQQRQFQSIQGLLYSMKIIIQI